jgi:N-hydroxyarylamine O-acetyltransferase
VEVARYLERIGYDGPLAADVATLSALQRAHLLAVPFDALDCHLGNPVTVQPADAYRKVVGVGRGGFCFELNGLFAWLLGELGFDVALLAARPAIGDDRYALPDAHLALLVDTGERWLVDVGFGRFSMAPLRIDFDGEQVNAGGRFRVARSGERASEAERASDADELLAEELGASSPNGYRFTLVPVQREFFAERCRAFSSDPELPFVRSASVQQVFADGWAAVRRGELTGVRGGTALDRALVDEDDWRAELLRQFGLEVVGSEVRRAR